uniref:Caspase-1 n=1 Tax=Aceria tosichella TaxID=561515 RepID=A0A6G1S3S0_9ACAR
MDINSDHNTQHDAAIAAPPQTNFFYSTVPPVRLTTHINALDYNMEHRHRGVCLIFDIEKFHPSRKLPRRYGSKVDSTALFNLFRSMSFEVMMFQDLTAKEIRYQLEYYSKLDHSNNDAFACCILTHGEHGQLWGTDHRFPVDMMFNHFLGNECPTLAGKPKLFFIQACQGDKLDDGVAVLAQDSIDSTTTYFKIPTHADFLIAYSTLPGFYSFRNTQEGSWFMQSLIKVLSDYHHDLDLLTMLTIVNHRVAYYKQSNANTPEFSGKKQVPCITSMLTRRVFLRPKRILI